MAVGPQPCLATSMNNTSVNMHFHGANISPTCHSDEVIHTIVNAGQSYTYSLKFPADEPPGLYWYHPHIHGFAEAALQGGASGAIIVDGIESVQPAVKGLPSRTLIMPRSGRRGRRDTRRRGAGVGYLPQLCSQ